MTLNRRAALLAGAGIAGLSATPTFGRDRVDANRFGRHIDDHTYAASLRLCRSPLMP